MEELIKQLSSVERDRATAAEICIDELLTIMDRRWRTPEYLELQTISSELSSALLEADGPAKRRERLLRVRAALTSAFPMTDADLEGRTNG